MDSILKRSLVIGGALVCLIVGRIVWVQSQGDGLSDQDRQYVAQKMEMFASMGAAPDDYARQVLEIQQRLRRGVRPSSRELLQVSKGLFGNAHPFVKSRAFGVLNTLAKRGQLPASVRNEAVDAGIEALRSPSLLLKTRGEILLRYAEDKRAIKPLLPLLKDPEPIAQQRAREALEALGYVAR